MPRLEGSANGFPYDRSLPFHCEEICALSYAQSISVAMCTYNGERFLREQLASIAAQTRLPDEMVVCDDGSSDATPEIVAEFGKTVSFPVRFFRNPKNLGSTKNFEQAIGLCTGDLIALCDQDDIWLPEKLARQAEMMERDPTLGGVFADAEIVDDKSQPIGKRLWSTIPFTPAEQKRFRAGQGATILLKNNVVTGATLMVRAELNSLFVPIPRIWVHDGWIAWMLTLYSRLALIDVPLIRYRIHVNQQVGVEAGALLRQLSFRQRLEKGKREEPAKHLSMARELEELDRKIVSLKEEKSQAILPGIRKKIKFQKDRGSPQANNFLRMACLLRNARNYQRYESGLKCFVRDIVMMFV